MATKMRQAVLLVGGRGTRLGDLAQNTPKPLLPIVGSKLFLDFLIGEQDYECTPWGSPSYSLLGWQKPCYLLNEGHYKSFRELLAATNWDNYGRASGNPQCADCMVHCGYEPTAAMAAFKPANMGRAMQSLIGV